MAGLNGRCSGTSCRLFVPDRNGPAPTHAADRAAWKENAMTQSLQKWFWILLVPALGGLGGVWFLRLRGTFEAGHPTGNAAWAAALFILAVITACAVPIVGRACFVHRMRHRRQVSEAEFYRFQRRQVLVVMATPYIALAAYALAVPGFYLTGIQLAMLYALYYHFPSRRRIGFDRRIFRVR
jgi:hypothetical protein